MKMVIMINGGDGGSDDDVTDGNMVWFSITRMV